MTIIWTFIKIGSTLTVFFGDSSTELDFRVEPVLSIRILILANTVVA
jgi:hypothetical protein